MAAGKGKAGKSKARGKQEACGLAGREEKVSGSATLRLDFSSEKSAKAAHDALLSEADFAHRGGSKVKLAGRSVVVEIKADDPVSLRASLNSYLRLMHIIKNLEEEAEKE